MIAQLPSLATVKSGLYRARRENLPPMPKTHSELNLSGEWAATVNGENFVLVDDGEDDKIVVFGTQSSLCHLAEVSTFFMDGTFSVCPSIFHQVFIIHIMKYGQTFPNKQRQTYGRAFLLMGLIQKKLILWELILWYQIVLSTLSIMFSVSIVYSM